MAPLLERTSLVMQGLEVCGWQFSMGQSATALAKILWGHLKQSLAAVVGGRRDPLEDGQGHTAQDGITVGAAAKVSTQCCCPTTVWGGGRGRVCPRG